MAVCSVASHRRQPLLTSPRLESTRTDRRNDAEAWEFECGKTLSNQRHPRVALEHTLPMATTNPDFDPFYLRYVAFYLMKWFIFDLLTDTSKSLQIYAEGLLKHRWFFSTGHSGKHGHEFLEFEYSHGRLRYANNSNYRNDSLIRKESE